MDISRRNFLKSAGLGCAAILSGCTSVASDIRGNKTNPMRPNIVIILTDDLGYGDVSFLNPESKIQTPHMDALASEGVWAVDAHSPSAICSPTRYGLLTGRYAWRGTLRKGVLMPWDEPAIEKDRLTLPAMLKTKGYDTACIGKWHLGFNWPWKGGEKPHKSKIRNGGYGIAMTEMFDWSKPITGGPWTAGFDYYFGDDVPNFPPYAFIEDGKLTCDPVDVDAKTLTSIGIRAYIHGSGPGEEGWTFEKVMPTITSRTVDYIQEHSKKSEPYFLLFSTTSPHAPHVPLKKFQGKSKAGYYGDYVIQTDDSIGQVIKALKGSGTFDNTLIIVTSDNGPAPFLRELNSSHRHSPAGHLRGMKWDTMEGGHRVPFIASWPKGKLTGGCRVDHMISLTDLFASIADIVKMPLEKGEAQDSLNVLPSLRKNIPVRTEMVYHAGNGTLGLRDKNWVYLRQGGNNKEPDWYKKEFQIEPVNAPCLLFDLDADEGEKVNLYHRYMERAKSMEARLQEIENSQSTR